MYMERKKIHCELCDYTTCMTADWFKHINSQKHQRNGKPKNRECDNCDYVTTMHWLLKQHILTFHSSKEERSQAKLYCDICDQVFFAPVYFKKHNEGIRHRHQIEIKKSLEDIQNIIKERNNNK
jgi:hypothetical protein